MRIRWSSSERIVALIVAVESVALMVAIVVLARIWLLASILALIFVTCGVGHVIAEKTARFVCRNEYQVCAVCRYPLMQGPDEMMKCPECGEYYVRDLIQTLWIRRLERHRLLRVGRWRHDRIRREIARED